MLTEPQQGALRRQLHSLADTCTKAQKDRLYFLLDDILQYGARDAAMVMYNEMENIRKAERS